MSDRHWRLFDSAPKDGERILAWDKREGRTVLVERDGDHWFSEGRTVAYPAARFSHWMPVPVLSDEERAWVSRDRPDLALKITGL